MAIDRIQTWESITHDVDLKLLLKSMLGKTLGEVVQLEKLLERHSIKGPDTHKAGAKVTVNVQVITDQYISEELLLVSQEYVEMLLRAIFTSTTNDSLRQLFKKFSLTALEGLELVVKYVKLKGWVEAPPLYPLIPQDVEDKIDSSEAFLLWDHLTYRYDNMRTTSVYYSICNDGDFKLILSQGRNQLKEQAAVLEKELLHFGVPLPIRPPSVTLPTKTLEIAEDDHLFRTLLAGMQGAGLLHAKAIKQSTTNDRVRKIFRQLLTDELEMLDKMIKYGKAKGWINPVPEFSEMLT